MSRKWFKYLVIGFLTLFISSSYLTPFISDPWSNYSKQCFMFIAVIIGFTLFIKTTIKLNCFALLFLLISTIPLIQYSFGILYYFEDVVLVSFYLLSFCLVYILGAHSTQIFSQQALYYYLCWGFLSLSCLSACIAIMQWSGYEALWIRVFNGDRPYANFGQPNHMATFHCMGLVGLLCLYLQKKIHVGLFLLLSILLISTLVLSQSRTVWISYFALILFSFIYIKSLGTKTLMSLIYFAVVYVVVSVGIQYLDHQVASTVLDRGVNSPTRIEMWKHMLYAIEQSPWWGYGWYQTQFAQLQGVFLYINEGYLTSAHNIVLDLILWNGIPLGLAISLLFLVLLYQILKQRTNNESLFIFMLIIPILCHAQLEYPLFYAYFLLAFAFILGALSSSFKTCLELNIQAVQLIYLLLLVFSTYIYKDITEAHYRLRAASSLAGSGAISQSSITLMTKLQTQTEFMQLKSSMPLTEKQWVEYENYIERMPTYYNLFKFAQILAFHNQQDRANEVLMQMNALYNKKHQYSELFEDVDQRGKMTIEHLKTIKNSEIQ